MRRRTLLKAALTVAAWLKVPGARAWAQEVTFPGARRDTLDQVAQAVLPASLGRDGLAAATDEFVQWVRDYRAGAAMSPGYGNPRVRFKAPSPAPRYQAQLEDLATSRFARADLAERRRVLAAAFADAEVQDLTGVPDGKHVGADLMSLWFASPAANDQAFQAQVGKDTCRRIEDSGARPAPLAPHAGAGR
jgi:hypothetical protein